MGAASTLWLSDSSAVAVQFLPAEYNKLKNSVFDYLDWRKLFAEPKCNSYAEEAMSQFTEVIVHLETQIERIAARIVP